MGGAASIECQSELAQLSTCQDDLQRQQQAEEDRRVQARVMMPNASNGVYIVFVHFVHLLFLVFVFC
jgi:hypothetical protein